jgi:hypothetical protein
VHHVDGEKRRFDRERDRSKHFGHALSI